MDDLKQLVSEAKSRKKEIAKMISSELGNKYVALYESESGYTLSAIQEGWHTRRNQMSFAQYDKRLFEKPIDQVEKEISDFEFYHNI